MCEGREGKRRVEKSREGKGREEKRREGPKERGEIS